jgi:hypothetical protein
LISSINFCHLNESILIIVGSADRKVSLHNILGTRIGIFGQPDLWKIKPTNQLFKELPIEAKELKNESNLPNLIDRPLKNDILINESKPVLEKKNLFDSIKQRDFDKVEYPENSDSLVKKLNSSLNLENTFNYEKEAFIKNPSLRYSPWSKTILGIVFDPFMY